MRLHVTKQPDKLQELSEEIDKIDLQIERSIRMEAFTQAAELKKKQENGSLRPIRFFAEKKLTGKEAYRKEACRKAGKEQNGRKAECLEDS